MHWPCWTVLVAALITLSACTGRHPVQSEGELYRRLSYEVAAEVVSALSESGVRSAREQSLREQGIQPLAPQDIDAYLAPLAGQLERYAAERDLGLVRHGQRLTLVLPPDTDLDARALAELLVAYPRTLIEVAGHSAGNANDALNMRRSRRLAAELAEHLSEQGLATARLIVRGYGSAYPTRVTSPEADQRIELTLAAFTGEV